MATTTNFGWETPDDTDLVKDGAAAIRTLGGAIDTSLVDLKGGTTGQILSKASNTDMDFTWVTSAGDIEGVTAGAGLSGGGTSGTVTLNLASTAAGRNAMINGGFDIWQRGTSFTTNGGTYCADRWRIGGSGTAPTVSRETFTLGAAPVAGYESPYFLRWNQSSAATDVQTFANRMEDVRTFAGQSVVLSFWARINSGTAAPAIYLQQVFGTGGSPSTAVTTTVAASQTFTSSWVRYSFAVSVPSISGKTIGTNNDSYLQMYFQFPTSGTWQIDLWGFQLELGSSATPFSRAGGTIQGELAACQRYYYRSSAVGNYTILSAYGNTASATLGNISIPLPVSMRVTPTSVDFANIATFDGAVRAITAISLLYANPITGHIETTVASGQTQYRPLAIISNNNSSGYIGFSAEL